MRRSIIAAGAVALALLAVPVVAQLGAVIQNPSSITPLQAIAFGTISTMATPVDATHPLPVDPVLRASAVDRGGLFGTSAAQLMPANASRHGFSVQNQSGGASCYISGQGTATADFHALKVDAGVYYENPSSHVGTAAISIICTGASTSVYAREW